MSRIVYVHANAEGIPFAATSYAAWDGFTKLGYDVRLYQSSELESLPLGRNGKREKLESRTATFKTWPESEYDRIHPSTSS